MFSSESSKASHSPKVGELRRMSMTTSRIAPRAQRTSLAWPSSRGPPRVWKCIPRTTPRREREWLSWTNSFGMPSSAHSSRR